MNVRLLLGLIIYNTVVGLIAGGDNAFVKAVEGAEDSKQFAVDDLKKIGLNEKDVVIGVAASGRTPYVIGGLEYAASINAFTCGLVCNRSSEIEAMCEHTIVVEPGPEVLTGSTRLKAGTATKLVLNMISTISMIRIGKVYNNYMVDVKMSNQKLITRGINIICSVTDCSQETAQATLEKADGSVKTAIVMVLLDCDKDSAEKALCKAKGRIQEIMDTKED